MYSRKILVMGLPGAGKTTLSRVLARRLGAVHFNADDVRANINKDLGFGAEDRIEQARRMGWLCDRVVEANGTAIADFVCPTVYTRDAFRLGGPMTIVFVDRIKTSRFADTNAMFVQPVEGPGSGPDFVVGPVGSPEYWAEFIARKLRPMFSPTKPTALFVGRYQPFHDGHRKLIEAGIVRVGQACVAVRDTSNDSKNPFPFQYVKDRIETGLRDYAGQFVVVQLPNITNIFYGRDVGYTIERIDLDDETHAISATVERAKLIAGE